MDLRKIIGWEVVDWIHLAQGRNQQLAIVDTILMNLHVLASQKRLLHGVG
jgi:hypothetical protein